MGKYFANPINVPYKYQFNKDPREKGTLKICRESADPSMILFQGRYYIFSSMSLGVYVSDDLVSFSYHKLPKNLPLYDYAPDVRVIGEYVYFCASSRDHICDRYRTKDILNGPYEKIKGTFKYWDPNLFVDDDGQIYFYYGCSNNNPLFGVKLDKNTFVPTTSPISLIYGDPYVKGYERIGNDNSIFPASDEEVEKKYKAFLKSSRFPSFLIPKSVKPLIRGMFTNKPYIEGAWMDKFNGKYYLQYACPGTEYNTYCDGVYVSSSPLGDFKLQENNPFSYKPGGFINGAGHGSTLLDKQGCLWHTSTMSISVNHSFERRIGLFRAGIDEDGELYCNQNFADYVYDIDDLRKEPFALPKWNLLSYKKKVVASSCLVNGSTINVVDENIKTIWQPNKPNNEWIEIDLLDNYDVRAIQVNFGDGKINIPIPGKVTKGSQARYIEEKDLYTRYILEGSLDQKNYFVLEDKSESLEDTTHDLIIKEDGIQARYIRLTIAEVPYQQLPAISGIRVFGLSNKASLPAVPKYSIIRTSKINIEIEIEKQENVTGYNVLFGTKPNKLYNSYMIFDNKVNIGALIKDKKYYFRVDAFNEAGIQIGEIMYEE